MLDIDRDHNMTIKVRDHRSSGIESSQSLISTYDLSCDEIGETTNELNPLKGLTRLLTLVEVKRKGEENH